MNEKVKLSFLITHYNRPQALLECIEAIKFLDYPNFEIVVSDDSSNKTNLDIIKKYPVNLVITSNKNLGLAGNINKGIKACKGDYIIYCQEDFLLKKELVNILDECFSVLKNQQADLIRFISSYSFKHVIPITQNIDLIPKFSWKNFIFQSHQYSDNPFITTKKFYDTYGYYLESTSGDYGETEFAIRIFKSKAKIAISNVSYVNYASNCISVIDRPLKKNRIVLSKKNIKFLRSCRLHLECFFYNNKKRGLLTYKNLRK
ncbi:glycosyltransferase [Olleya sp. AS48]|uniref:glycosyltransferase family 2 protein n=1 Tax=Olleya sp. AS48 TaxID=3135774 RepID=UPI003182894D